MPENEGVALHEIALRAGRSRAGRSTADGATFVEIGSWCGKSTVYLGAAAEATGSVVFSIDHHRGSEENQSGWEHHDSEVVDPRTGRIDTLGHWRSTIERADLEGSVVGVVGESSTVALRWQTPIDLLFIDGGHGEIPAWADYLGWAPMVAMDGWLAIHDVFEDPSLGGRPPYDLWKFALRSGEFAEDAEEGSLRILRRISPEKAAGR